MRLEADGESHAGGLVRLASGVDALYLSGRCELAEGALDRLAEAKAKAAAGYVTEFQVGGVPFAVSPHGFGRYTYRLEHQRGLIGITGSANLPAFRVQPLSTALHEMGPDEPPPVW